MGNGDTCIAEILADTSIGSTCFNTKTKCRLSTLQCTNYTAKQISGILFLVIFALINRKTNRNAPHLRSGWVVLIPLLQSCPTYGSKKKSL
jgi:hypothetical protein